MRVHGKSTDVIRVGYKGFGVTEDATVDMLVVKGRVYAIKTNVKRPCNAIATIAISDNLRLEQVQNLVFLATLKTPSLPYATKLKLYLASRPCCQVVRWTDPTP